MLKTVSSVINALGALNYKGTWDASTNTPTLTSGVGSKGDYYVVSVAGTTNLDGITDWQVGDWAVFNGTTWQKIDNTDLVVSVNGKTGAVVLTANDVGATPNTAYVLTSGLLSGGGQLTGNVTVGLASVPVANVTGAVANTTTVSAGGLLSGGGNLASNVTISLANVPVANVPGAVPNTVNVLVTSPVTGGGALTGNVTIGISQANSTTNGYLSSTDWNTFNNKQPSGTYVTSVSGTSGRISSTGGTTPTLDLITTTVSAGSYGSASNVSAITVDAYGRITAASNTTIAIANTQVSGLGTMSTQNANNVAITGGSINVQTTNLTSVTAATATFATDSLPLVPAGYIQVDLNGTVVKIPYYAV